MFLYIPLELCEYAIRNNLYRSLQLYIYLKSICCGKLKIRPSDYEQIGTAIGLTSGKAVKNNLKILLELNWIGYDKSTGYYFVRGFERVRAIHGFRSRTAAEFDTSCIADFKAFIAATKIGYLINNQKRKKRAIELDKGSSAPVARHSSDFYPVTNEALAKILDISISTAYNLKQLAVASGFIAISKTFVDTGICADEQSLVKKGLPEIAQKMIIKESRILLQGKDMVRHFIRFKRRKKIESERKKLETYIKGVIGGK